MLWQLRNLENNQNLNEPQKLPENWGPIFGMYNFKDRLNNLSWVGMPNLGWFEVGEEELDLNLLKEEIDATIAKMLSDCSEYVAADNTTITKDQRIQWINYRKALKEIYLQPDYPKQIYWPKKPDM